MEEDQQFCLRWNNHQSTLISVFDTLLENGTLVDCTLAAEGKFLKAHKVVLSACSPYFATLLSEQYDKHPIFILKDVKYQELRAMMDYMYRGEVNISQDQLAALLKAAESLQIKGLSDNRGGAGSGGVGAASGGKAGEPQKHSTGHVPGKLTNIGHIGAGYTLEQHKRARIGPSSIDSQDIGGSREGSSSPTSRRRKKIRRRSVDQVMGDNHENSNSSQNMQINSSVTGPGAITTSIVPSGAVAQAASGNQIQTQTNKKTDILSKLDQGVSVSTINPASATAAPVGSAAGSGTVSEHEHEHDEGSSNKKEHHHNLQSAIKKDKEVGGGGVASSAASSSDIVIEPKSEYDDGNEETVEDLTLDDEIALDELDQTAGPSHGGEGSSQGYAQWQVDRSHDESYMAQDVQQRDPQDLSRKLNPKLKPNPASVIKQPLKKILLNNNVVPVAVNKQPQRISITQMSDMLLDFYKTNNAAKAPKNEPIRQTSPSSADGAESQNTNENKCPKEMKSKNINNNYSVSKKQSKVSVIQPPMMNNSTPVAAFAAALFRDGYNNFQNQLRAQEILKGQQQRQQQARLPEPAVQIKEEQVSPTKAQFLQNFLLKDRRVSDNGGGSSGISGTIGTSDEEGQFTEGDDDSKYSGFDDIHLIEGSKTMHYGSNSNDYMSDESQHKFLLANNLKNLEFSLGGGPAGAQHYTNLAMAGDEPMYECRHCGKRYRWKSTLRRHENVECGGKEPSHQCPYCPYKSKQRGNLGVHVRKHHSNMPQLQSKRRSKYSVKLEDNNITI